MNNEELKKKIIETLEKGGHNFLKSKEMKVSIYEYYADALIAARIGDVKDLQVQVASLEITNIALQAGYDDAEKDRLYWVDKYKEAEHRAEVAERALENEIKNRINITGDAEGLVYTYYGRAIYQAEKELAEEKREP